MLFLILRSNSIYLYFYIFITKVIPEIIEAPPPTRAMPQNGYVLEVSQNYHLPNDIFNVTMFLS